MNFKGTNGDDTYVGTRLADLIEGLRGRDRLNGGGGNDTIAGDGGADWLDGGDGNDVLFGGSVGVVPDFRNQGVGVKLDDRADADTLIGGEGNDTIFAGLGDAVDGGAGSDRLALSLEAAESGMTIDLDGLTSGGTRMIGTTTVSGIEDLLWLRGTKFDDVIQGFDFFASGDGVIDGGDGNDTINVESQATLHGGAGNDVIGGQAFYMYGDEGDDTIVTSDSAYGGDGDDTISSADFASGGSGDDRLIGLEFVFGDTLWGDEGDDSITGSGKGDNIAGGSGADTIDAGAGDDDISTAGPRDQFRRITPDTGAEYDQVKAGSGDDIVAIGYGDDADGGAGRDQLSLSLAGAAQGVVISITSIGGGAAANGPGTIRGFEEVLAITGSGFGDTITSLSGDIDGGSGNDRLSLTGGQGVIRGGDGDDTIVGGGAAGFRYGGAGSDTIDYSALSAGVSVGVDDFTAGGGTFRKGGALQSDTLYEIENIIGTSQNDNLGVSGGAGISHHIQGGGGNDILTTSGATAWLEGGDGDDKITLRGESFVAGTISLSGGAGRDTLVLPDNGHVSIDLTTVTIAADFEALNAGNADVTMRTSQVKTMTSVTAGSLILADAGTVNFSAGAFSGKLYLSDFGNRAVLDNAGTNSVFGGNGADAIIGGAGIEIIHAGGGNDLVDGGSAASGTAANELYGEDGDDRVVGGQGADLLDGGAGRDRMQGGLGNDRYFVDNTGDIVFEAANGGTDGVVSSVSFTLAANIENLTLTDAAVSGTGNALANIITGNDVANVLNGGTGADRLIGGYGDDSYVLDAGDTIVEAADGGIDTVQAFANYTLGANIENLALAGSARAGTGNDLTNLITGSAGNDVLSGLGGDDTIDGGGGNDRMVGGNGNDAYVVNSSADTIVENADEGSDSVTAGADFVLSENVESLQLVGGARAGTGNSGANVIIGSAGDDTLSGMAGSDVLSGGAGNDTIVGGTGQDALFGDAGADRFVFRAGDTGNSYQVADGIVDFSQAQGDRIDVSALGSLRFVGSAGFSGHAGEVRYEAFDGDTLVSIDTNGDRQADLVIGMIGAYALNAADFILG